MNEQKDGGPAFPILDHRIGYHCDIQQKSAGLSIRDYAAIHGAGLPENCTHTYAGQFNADPKPTEGDAIAWAEWWAKAEWTARFINADAMIAAREARHD